VSRLFIVIIGLFMLRVVTMADAQVTFSPLNIPDPSKLVMPKLDFSPTDQDQADFDKYFYFHRENTTFEEAYVDIRECGSLANGMSYYRANSQYGTTYMPQYGIVGNAIGGAIGAAIGDAIWGSAKRRATARINMRTCMGFKGYQRYGLPREIWSQFNFQEGNGRKPEDVREHDISIQALVASGSKPLQKELPL
jgi:hypothetical protein